MSLFHKNLEKVAKGNNKSIKKFQNFRCFKTTFVV